MVTSYDSCLLVTQHLSASKAYVLNGGSAANKTKETKVVGFSSNGKPFDGVSLAVEGTHVGGLFCSNRNPFARKGDVLRKDDVS